MVVNKIDVSDLETLVQVLKDFSFKNLPFVKRYHVDNWRCLFH